MCYSALVNQSVKDLGLRYGARIQVDLFEELFENRLKGSGARIPRALEAEFLDWGKSAQENRIERSIREYHALELSAAREELHSQTERLLAAERSLLAKVTQKAQNEQRIARNKIDSLNRKIGILISSESEGGQSLLEEDSRIFPGSYAPLVTRVAGESVVAPFRYLLRPAGEDPGFDRKYNGAYNIRRDSLDRVHWWKKLYGKNHAVLEVRSFFENVTADGTNAVIRFDPQDGEDLRVPCLFDVNRAGPFPLYSFGLITDHPNPEVLRAGHDRTPVFMKSSHLDLWLDPTHHDPRELERVFDDKQPTFFTARRMGSGTSSSPG